MQFELSTDQKVAMQIRAFTDLKGKTQLLLSMAKFSHNLMDGAIRTVTVDSLLA